MKAMLEFVGKDALAQGTVKEYDEKIILPLLTWIYFHLNPMVALVFKIISFVYDDVFSQQIYNEHVTFSTLKNELQLFHCWHKSSLKCDNFFK
jgi:hypothetical protein